MGKVKPSPRYAAILATRQEEVRHGRNFIRHGDLVKVRGLDGKRGFKARFQHAEMTGKNLDHQVYVVHEVEGRELAYVCVRTIEPERIVRTASTHDPLKRAQRKREGVKA